MVKKIAKYSKFVLCVALILSLVAPTYAALSASDGSAFVTKAEFDSALADFNARLTTFEAGINSKIDSQVTSYLDRNGIWNGKKQEVITNNVIWSGCRNFSNGGTITASGGDFTALTAPLDLNQKIPGLPTVFSSGVVYSSNAVRLLENKINKSGLAYVNAWFGGGCFRVTGGSMDIPGAIVMNLIFSQKKGTGGEEILYSCPQFIFVDLSIYGGTMQSSAFAEAGAPSFFSWYLFVSKDYDLYARLDVSWNHINSVNASSIKLREADSYATKRKGFMFAPLSVVVY